MSQCVVCAAEIRDDARFCPACGAEQPKQATASDDQDPFIGQIVARNFRIEKLLGVGGMGKVYKARQLSLDKDVVIKILHDHFRDDPQLVQRFQREARAASRLNHPNSIQVIDFGQDNNGVLFMAIEFLNGRDLFGILKEDGPLSAERLAKMMIQVCSALAEAHAQNVIHRDLKPENIMIVDHRGTEHVKVLDFGIAKIQDPDETPGQALTQAGMVCGTPEYMSPEQARGLKLDHRSDLYALGVVCYQLATGELPFTADTPIGIVTKHILEDPEPPSKRFPQLNIPAALEQLILKSMAKDAQARFATASEMGTAFEVMLRQVQLGPATPPPAPVAVGSGTMVGVAAAGHPSTGGAVAPQAPVGPPHNPTSIGTAPSQPAPVVQKEPPAVVVKTFDDAATGGTPTRPTPTARPFHADGLVTAGNDDLAPTGGGAAKWVALVALFLLVIAGGAVFAFKDVLFPPGDVPIVANGPETPSPETKSPETKSPETKSPETKSPETKSPETKSPETKSPETKSPETKSPETKSPETKSPETKSPTTTKHPKDETTTKSPPVKNGNDVAATVRVAGKRDRAKAKELMKSANNAFASGDKKKAYDFAKEAMKADETYDEPLLVIAFYHKSQGNLQMSCKAAGDYVIRKKLSRDKGEPLRKRYCE